jgi:hypothetical protein
MPEKSLPCPVCDRALVDAADVQLGRPRVYCSERCRRTSEQRVKRFRATLRWARGFVEITPSMRQLFAAAWGQRHFEARMRAAEDIVQAAENLEAREAT